MVYWMTPATQGRSQILIAAQCAGRTLQAGKVPRKQFHTIPIGPQLQALWRTSEGAKGLGYRKEYMEKIREELRLNDGKRVSSYSDIFHGSYILKAARKNITHD
jgi:hypothetical protein